MQPESQHLSTDRSHQLQRVRLALDAGNRELARSIFFEGIYGFLARVSASLENPDIVRKSTARAKNAKSSGGARGAHRAKSHERLAKAMDILRAHPDTTVVGLCHAAVISEKTARKARALLGLGPRPLGRNLRGRLRELLQAMPDIDSASAAGKLHCTTAAIRKLRRDLDWETRQEGVAERATAPEG